jgi:hypothetical protein
MQYFFKYLTMAPVMAILAFVILFVVFIQLNYIYPGLQYGTYFHPLP